MGATAGGTQSSLLPLLRAECVHPGRLGIPGLRAPIRQPHWMGVVKASSPPSPVSSVLPSHLSVHLPSRVTCVLTLSQVNTLVHTCLPTHSQAQLPLRLVAEEQAGVWGPSGLPRSQHQGLAPPLGCETSHTQMAHSSSPVPVPLGTDCPQLGDLRAGIFPGALRRVFSG